MLGILLVSNCSEYPCLSLHIYAMNSLSIYILNVSTWSEQQVMLFYTLNTKYRNPTPTQPDSHYFSLVGVITMILTAYLEHPSEEGNNWRSREILAWDGRPKSPGCPSSTVGLKDQMTAKPARPHRSQGRPEGRWFRLAKETSSSQIHLCSTGPHATAMR